MHKFMNNENKVNISDCCVAGSKLANNYGVKRTIFMSVWN